MVWKIQAIIRSVKLQEHGYLIAMLILINGVSIHELEEKKIDIIHTSPSHHFPTGIVMPVSRRYELLGWAAKKKQRYIIEDDYDSELRLSGKAISDTAKTLMFQEGYLYEHLYKNAASTCASAMAVLPEVWQSVFIVNYPFIHVPYPISEQYTAQFMKNGSFENI